MLDLPWYVAPDALKAGDTVRLGVTTYTVAADVPAGAILGAATDDRLYPLTADPDPTPDPTPRRKTRATQPAAPRRARAATRPARPARDG